MMVAAEVGRQDHQRKLLQLAGRKKSIEAQILALQVEAESETAAVNLAIAQQALHDKNILQNSRAMEQLRGGDKSRNGSAKEI